MIKEASHSKPSSSKDEQPFARHQHRSSRRDCPSFEAGSVASVRERLSKVVRTVLELSDLDPSLLRKSQRDRLRLITARMLGYASNDAIGEAINDLNALRRRGFPVRGYDEPNAPRAARDMSRNSIQCLRKLLGTELPKEIEERLFVETTLDFLETKTQRQRCIKTL